MRRKIIPNRTLTKTAIPRGLVLFMTACMIGTGATETSAQVIPVPPPPPPVATSGNAGLAAGSLGVGIFIGVVGALCLHDFLSKVTRQKPWVDPVIGEPYLRRN